MENRIKEGISIITIVLNGKKYIEETILSVINQGFNDLEYIIIDGGSTDGTLEVISKYEGNITIICSERDGGIYQAINKGISFCNNSLVGIIHSGDRYLPNALNKAFQAYRETDSDVIYGDIEVMEEEGDEYIVRKLKPHHKMLAKKMSIFHPSTFVKLSVYRELGLYDCNYRIVADYDFFLRLFIAKRNFFYVPIVLAKFRTGGISGKNFGLLLRENYKIREKYFGVIRSLSYILFTTIVYSIFRFRKGIIILIIGRKKYFSLKIARYKKLGS